MTIAKSNLMPGDATGKIVTDVAAKNRNKPHVSIDTFEVLTTDAEAGDILELMQIPTGAIINKISIINDTLDSVADLEFDLGFYDRDGVAVDVDILVDGSDELQTANTAMTQIYAPDVDSIGLQVYKVAVPAETVDPVQDYTLAITFTVVAATPVAGTLGFQVEWVHVN